MLAVAAGAMVLLAACGSSSVAAPTQTGAGATSPSATSGALACLTVSPPANHGGATQTLNGANSATCLADGAAVTVAVHGFAPNSGVALLECGDPQLLSGADCDIAHIVLLTTDATGGATGTFKVLKSLASATPHTCGATERCMIAASPPAPGSPVSATDYLTFSS